MTVGTNGVVDPASLFSTLQGFITGPLLTGSITLFVVGLTIKLAFKWVKKFAK